MKYFFVFLLVSFQLFASEKKVEFDLKEEELCIKERRKMGCKEESPMNFKCELAQQAKLSKGCLEIHQGKK